MRNKLIIAVLGIVALISAGTYYFYTSGQQKVSALQSEQNGLRKQQQQKQKAYAELKDAAEIKTESWKRYCDEVIHYCFKYPADWLFEGGGIGVHGHAGATITSPDKSVQIIYTGMLIRDGGVASAHIVQASDMTIAGTKLKLIGDYPVSRGIYKPKFSILNDDSAKDMVPGKIGPTIINARFDIDKHQAIAFSAQYIATGLTSSAAAEAWFESINGKTTKAILASFAAE